jgi:dephospho-CoA kinase
MTAFVGLTGGIASGKSTVARLFRALGIGVVDADEVAREIVLPGTPGLEAVIEAFGREVLDASGALDRKALGARVFADPAKRKTLEAITHPRIFARSMELLGEHARAGGVYAMYEAALLVENQSYRMFQALVVVAAKRETQLARIAARDGLSEADAEARLDAQLPLQAKVDVADHVIWNDGDLPALELAVRDVHEALVRRFAEVVEER